ncbi:MAG: hypothetical protein C7B44_01425 [Sulfobacillus thermosulfidooxidans]|nr:MAG: hypothetical protein C7B44_01425 [Sulfobacillus thermosulfidooxidans]
MNHYSREAFIQKFSVANWAFREGTSGHFTVKIGPNSWYVVVRSSRRWRYPYITKASVLSYTHWAMGLAHYLNQNDEPDLFLIPGHTWLDRLTTCLADRDYPNKASAPEWGVDLSRTNYGQLDPFRWNGKSFPWAAQPVGQ